MGKENRRQNMVFLLLMTVFIMLLCLGMEKKVLADNEQGTLEVLLNGQETTCTINWSGFTMPSDGKQLLVAVWSEQGDQDDLVWRNMTEEDDGTWSVSFKISEHATAGTYYVHLYLRTTGDTMKFQDAANFEVEGASCAGIEVKDMDTSAGSCRVVISGLTSPSGITGVKVPVWSKNDQSDIIWYSAYEQSDGTWEADVDFSKHSFNSGTYYFHVYANSKNRIFNFVGATTADFEMDKPEVMADLDGDELNMKASGLAVPGGISCTYFAVWSDTKGQDDIHWNRVAYNSSTASAETTVSLEDYSDYGTYFIHVYAATKTGKMVFMGSTAVDVPAPSVENIDISVENAAFTVTVSGISSPVKVSSITVPVWSKNDQSDIVWYKAEKVDEDTYQVQSDVSKHNKNTGTYHAHVYVSDTRGSNMVYAGGRDFNVSRSAGELKASADQSRTNYVVSIHDICIPEDYKSLLMAVWTEQDGQDDLKWYTAEENGSTCAANIPLADHNYEEGTYNLHLYAQQKNGTMLLVNVYTFEVKLTNILIFENQTDGAVDVRIKLSSDIRPSAVSFPVWSADDQSDIYWYRGVKQSDGSYKASINIGNHANHTGTYYVHVYYTDANGMHLITTDSIEMTADPTTYTGEMLSCLITDDDTVTVQASVSGYGTYGLFKLDAGSDEIDPDAVPIATCAGSGTITLTAPLNLNSEDSLLDAKMAVAVKSGDAYIQLTSGMYITNPEAVAAQTRDFPTLSSKKGLSVNTGLLDDAAELGATNITVNIVLTNLFGDTGEIPYYYKGKTYYMNASYVSALDAVFSESAANGAITSAILLMPWDSEHSDLIIASGRTPGYSFYGLNAEEQDARDQLGAVFSFLAARYSDEGHNVVNWILGNEVSNDTDYNWCGNISLSEYAQYYADAFRLLYNSVKSQYSNARVYISLDHVWTHPRSYGFTGKELLTAFAEDLAAEGDITWCVAFHPYPNPITSANFWSNTYGVSFSSDSLVYTMLNLSSLTDYIKSTYGSQHRFILSETGFTSWSNGLSDEKTQAAAIAYAYYLAESNDMVDAFVVHRQVDHKVEMAQGLYLGLWYNDSSEDEYNTSKKLSWTVFKYMDTHEGAAYTNFALSVIGADSWSSIVPGYSAERYS